MNRAFLITDSNRSLTPLLSPAMVNSMFYSTCIAVGCLLGSWPRSEINAFFQNADLPINGLIVFSVVLILLSFVAVRSASGEMTYQDADSALNLKQLPLELYYPFLTYGLIRFATHNLLVMLPFLPIMILSATLTGFSVAAFAKLLTILFNTAMFCRVVAFQFYLKFHQHRLKQFFSNLLFLLLFLVITIFLYWPLNPLAQIYRLSSQPVYLKLVWFPPWEFYMITTSVIMAVLVVGDHIVIRNRRTRGFI